MYESHFGLSAPPFQLSPDPSFYFESKGHSNALAYLRFGAYQGEGFIVVTGEIGAGKTTLVRALLSELDTEKVVAAQVVSTQLEAGDLLKSILAAFGVPSDGLTKAGLIATLEAFLTVLATRGQRALLIIDEAQNLNLEAVEEMRMLSNFQFDQHALLQSFLVGQPELRKLLQTKSMEQLRQRVIASCHLGPLSGAETRAYIEHRLRKVGWQDRPHFTDDAFEAIHQATGGIPRRINVLCNRVMLAAYLADIEQIDGDAVRDVADELRAEVGDQASIEALPQSSAHSSASAVKSLPSAGEVMRLQRTPGVKPERPLLLVADTPDNYVKLRALAASLERAASPCAPVVVTPHSPREVRIEDAALEALAAPPLEVCLNVSDVRGAELMAQVLLRFDAQLVDLHASAVAVIGDGPAMLACALACEQRGTPLLRLDGGAREAAVGSEAVLIDRLAQKVFTRSVSAHFGLAREGVSADRIQCIGSLYGAVVQSCVDARPDAADVLKQLGVGAAVVDPSRAYGVMTLAGTQSKVLARQIDALLSQLKGSVPMLWLVDGSTADAVRAAALEARLERQRVVLLPMPGLSEALSLLSGAAVAVVDRAMVLAELAGVLRIPLVELAAEGSNAEEVARAVADVLAQPVTREPSAIEDRATGAVLEWLAATVSIDSATSRTASGPARPR